MYPFKFQVDSLNPWKEMSVTPWGNISTRTDPKWHSLTRPQKITKSVFQPWFWSDVGKSGFGVAPHLISLIEPLLHCSMAFLYYMKCGGSFKSIGPERHLKCTHTVGQRSVGTADKLPDNDIMCRVCWFVWGKVYFKSQILVHEYWTILDHFCVPVL